MRARLLAALLRIYGAALVVCPRPLRDRYGVEMRATFAERCRDAAAHGIGALLRAFAVELGDLAFASVATRRAASPAIAPIDGAMSSLLWNIRRVRFLSFQVPRMPPRCQRVFARASLDCSSSRALDTRDARLADSHRVHELPSRLHAAR